MVKLSYNLDEIKTQAYDTGRVRAKLRSVKKGQSRAKNPMLVFKWRILTGEDKGRDISSYPSLLDSSLGNLKEHLEALGLKGKVNRSSDKLIGRIAVLVIGESPAQEGQRPYVGVIQVLPKSSPLHPVDDDEDDDDEDENEEEEEDEDEEEDDDDEDYEDDDDD